MIEEGVLRSEKETCRGGMRRVYYMELDESGLKKQIAETVIGSLLDDFPEETREIL